MGAGSEEAPPPSCDSSSPRPGSRGCCGRSGALCWEWRSWQEILACGAQEFEVYGECFLHCSQLLSLCRSLLVSNLTKSYALGSTGRTLVCSVRCWGRCLRVGESALCVALSCECVLAWACLSFR